MNEHEPVRIDLRQRGELPAHTYAYYKVRDLQPGQVFELIADEPPRLLMESVSLQMRHGIHWRIVEQGPPVWTVRVQAREDVAAETLTELLERDHLVLDGLFADALHKVNAGKLEEAADDLRAFSRGLRRHLHVENEILAQVFQAPRDPLGQDPTSVMIREHEQIVQQLELIEGYFSGELGDTAEVAPFMGMLSGQLAKHETREEQNLFPNWQAALRRAGPESEKQLLNRVLAMLSGEEDAALGLDY